MLNAKSSYSETEFVRHCFLRDNLQTKTSTTSKVTTSSAKNNLERCERTLMSLEAPTPPPPQKKKSNLKLQIRFFNFVRPGFQSLERGFL